jgi:hypothetical protein
MIRTMTRLARATRAGAFTAMLAITGLTAVMASVKTARAWDQQANEASQDDAANRQAAGEGLAVAPQPGPYASAHRERPVASLPAAQKDFQDIK